MMPKDKRNLGHRTHSFRRKWHFDWPILQVLFGGLSPIDLPELPFSKMTSTHDFIKGYGFDMGIQSDQKSAHALLAESLYFIEHHLAPREWKRGMRPPEAVLFCEDPRELVWRASQRGSFDALEGAWSCALLRIMHTAAHLDAIWRRIDLHAATEQLKKRFEKHIKYNRDGTVVLKKDHQSVLLRRLDWKPPKKRSSVFLKLLHKPANVAETVYDLIGLRIVTDNFSDAIRAVQYLTELHVLSFANIIPARSRNSLVDLDQFRIFLDHSGLELNGNRVSLEKLEEKMSQVSSLKPEVVLSENKHSSQEYRSIQLTCRQLLLDSNSCMEDDLFQGAGKHLRPGSQAANFLEELIKVKNLPKTLQNEEKNTNFFPFEVQVLDRESYQNSRHGEASHSSYKLAQVRTARKRILGEVLTLWKRQKVS